MILSSASIIGSELPQELYLDNRPEIAVIKGEKSWEEALAPAKKLASTAAEVASNVVETVADRASSIINTVSTQLPSLKPSEILEKTGNVLGAIGLKPPELPEEPLTGLSRLSESEQRQVQHLLVIQKPLLKEGLGEAQRDLTRLKELFQASQEDSSWVRARTLYEQEIPQLSHKFATAKKHLESINALLEDIGSRFSAYKAPIRGTRLALFCYYSILGIGTVTGLKAGLALKRLGTRLLTGTLKAPRKFMADAAYRLQNDIARMEAELEEYTYEIEQAARIIKKIEPRISDVENQNIPEKRARIEAIAAEIEKAKTLSSRDEEYIAKLSQELDLLTVELASAEELCAKAVAFKNDMVRKQDICSSLTKSIDKKRTELTEINKVSVEFTREHAFMTDASGFSRCMDFVCGAAGAALGTYGAYRFMQYYNLFQHVDLAKRDAVFDSLQQEKQTILAQKQRAEEVVTALDAQLQQAKSDLQSHRSTIFEQYGLDPLTAKPSLIQQRLQFEQQKQQLDQIGSILPDIIAQESQNIRSLPLTLVQRTIGLN